MKSLFSLLAVLLAGSSSFAQFTTNSGNTTTTDKVGIGTTTSPKTNLEIRKDAAGAQGPVLELTNGSGNPGASSEIYFSTYGRTATGVPSARIKVADNDAWGGNFLFDTKGNSSAAPLYTRLFIHGASGNVGIGTTNPQSPLNVRGSVNGLIRLTPTSDNAEASIHFSSRASETDNTARWSIGPGVYNNGANFAIGSTLYGSAVATFLTNGNVGIGTSSPDTKLAVNGTIHSREVKVDMNGWADYVFKPTYRLQTLTEIKEYIDKNKHLPDMPSEQEVAKEGISLGEMNRLLLKKVEELTLYMIEMEMENQEMKKEFSKKLIRLKKRHG